MTTEENTDKPDAVEDVTTATDVESGAEEAEEAEEAEASLPDRSIPGTLRRYLAAIVLALVLIASAAVAAGFYYMQYRPDQQTDAAATNVAVEAAKNGSIAMLSYSPETLDKDFTNAKSGLTGDFLNYYTQFTEQIVTPAAKQKLVKTSASVVRAAASEMRRDSAVVLLFINQVTTSKENPDGAFAASAVRVGMTKVDGRWLISAFDPV